MRIRRVATNHSSFNAQSHLSNMRGRNRALFQLASTLHFTQFASHEGAFPAIQALVLVYTHDGPVDNFEICTRCRCRVGLVSDNWETNIWKIAAEIGAEHLCIISNEVYPLPANLVSIESCISSRDLQCASLLEGGPPWGLRYEPSEPASRQF